MSSELTRVVMSLRGFLIFGPLREERRFTVDGFRPTRVPEPKTSRHKFKTEVPIETELVRCRGIWTNRSKTFTSITIKPLKTKTTNKPKKRDVYSLNQLRTLLLWWILVYLRT